MSNTSFIMNIFLSVFCLLSCLHGTTWAAESSTTTTTKSASSSKKSTVTTAAPSGDSSRGARMDISDAQLEMALKDKRYLQRQLKCTLGEAPCDPVGRRLKTLAPLVIRGACPQCTPTETRQIQKVLLHIQKNFPKEWIKVVRTYA